MKFHGYMVSNRPISRLDIAHLLQLFKFGGTTRLARGKMRHCSPTGPGVRGPAVRYYVLTVARHTSGGLFQHRTSLT